MERSIQQACTNRSRAWPQFAWDSESQRKNVSSDYSVLKARPSKKYWTVKQKCVILIQLDRSVSMTVRFHLFPFRTQKLSLLVPKIVSWKRLVKIGSRRLNWKLWDESLRAFLLPFGAENSIIKAEPYTFYRFSCYTGCTRKGESVWINWQKRAGCYSAQDYCTGADR